MALYSQCFSWIIMKINQKIKGNDNFKSIGILDIFGFENFEVRRSGNSGAFAASWRCVQPFKRNLPAEPTLPSNHSLRSTALNNSTSTTPTRSSRSISTSTSSLWSSWSTTGEDVQCLNGPKDQRAPFVLFKKIVKEQGGQSASSLGSSRFVPQDSCFHV